MYNAPDTISEPLYVISPIFNPIRYKSRWKHYERWAKYVVDSGAILITVEAAYGERGYALEGIAPTHVTEACWNPHGHPHQYIKVRTKTELWVKENLIDIGISMLPEDAKYVAWVDADVTFARPNWVGETVHQLQHYKVVQMFSEVVDVGPRYAILQTHRGFMWCHLHGCEPEEGFPGTYYMPPQQGMGKPYMWHPGFAWAARKKTIDDLGGMIDFAVLGAADNHMARALIGKVAASVHADSHPQYLAKLLAWQELAERHVRHNVGYVSGLLVHYWHGRKVDRRYWDRWRILVDYQFNPELDLKYDGQGVIQLVDHGTARDHKFRDALMRYFRARNEDSIDLSGVQDEG